MALSGDSGREFQGAGLGVRDKEKVLIGGTEVQVTGFSLSRSLRGGVHWSVQTDSFPSLLLKSTGKMGMEFLTITGVFPPPDHLVSNGAEVCRN